MDKSIITADDPIEFLTPQEEILSDEFVEIFFTEQADLEEKINAVLSRVSPPRREMVLDLFLSRIYGEKAIRRDYLASVLGITGSRDEIERRLLLKRHETITDQALSSQLQYFLIAFKNLHHYKIVAWQRKNDLMFKSLADQPIEKLEELKKELEFFTQEFYDGGYQNLQFFKPHRRLSELFDSLLLGKKFERQGLITSKVVFAGFLINTLVAIILAKENNVNDINHFAAMATLPYSKMIPD